MTNSVLFARWRSSALCLAAGGLLAACATPYSEAPIASNFETTKQLKLQAASHWNAIAGDAANSIANALKLGKGCIAPTPECNMVFVREVKNPSAFAVAFRTQFITSLVNRGVNVAKVPAGSIEIDFDIQPLKFSAERRDGKFVSAAYIYAGLWALHGVWEDVSEGGSVGLALGAFDMNRWMTSDLASGPTPQHEIIVTASASSAERYLGRVTNVYYLADTDGALYKSPPRLTTMSIVGGK